MAETAPITATGIAATTAAAVAPVADSAVTVVAAPPPPPPTGTESPVKANDAALTSSVTAPAPAPALADSTTANAPAPQPVATSETTLPDASMPTSVTEHVAANSTEAVAAAASPVAEGAVAATDTAAAAAAVVAGGETAASAAAPTVAPETHAENALELAPQQPTANLSSPLSPSAESSPEEATVSAASASSSSSSASSSSASSQPPTARATARLRYPVISSLSVGAALDESTGTAHHHADGKRRDFGCQTTLVGRHVMLSALGVAAAVAETDLTVLVRVICAAFFFVFGIDTCLFPIFVGEFVLINQFKSWR